MKKVNITIDGREFAASAGTTVLEAAKGAGIFIPTLCHDEELSSVGACRLCVVQINGARQLDASCVTRVSEGMVVETASEAVVEARKTILELMLASHPADCMTCQKMGDCKLADYAYYYGVRGSSFGGERRHHPLDDSNPVIVRDTDKCILCGKCVRVCDEIQGRNVIDFMYRGFETRIGPAFDEGLGESNCVSCGSCLAVCPVGALTEKGMHGRGRPWEIEKVKTTCGYCGCGCNFDLNVYNGKVIGVSSNEDSVVNGRHLCVKGRFGYDFIHHPQRLTMPLIKREGVFEEASWEEALNYLAKNLNQIKIKHGGESLAVLSSARCTNEENYLMNKIGRAGLGTNNIDHCARHNSAVAGLAIAFGSGAMTNSIHDIKEADCIFIVGSNTTEAHPIISLEVRKAVKSGATLIVADPLQLHPATNIALLNAMMHVIFEEGMCDADFIATRTEGVKALRDSVEKYTPEYAQKITGVPADFIRKAARTYASVEKASIIYTMGVTQHDTGTNNVMALANLAMLCGNIGKPGTGVNLLREQNNVQGACDMGALPDVYTAYQKVDVHENRVTFSGAWQKELPVQPGLTIGEIFDGAVDGSIKGLYIMGENPMLSDPDVDHVQTALKSLDFLVVQDIFLTETAKLADLVLPGASFAEKEGTFTNTERRVQRVRKAIEPVGNSRADWEILRDVGQRMGLTMDYTSAEDVFEEMRSLTPSYAGMTYARLEKDGLQWPCPSEDHPGTPILHVDHFPRGLGKFTVVEQENADEMPDDEYPWS